MCVVQLRDADATRELLTDAQQRTAQLQADLMQARQDAQQASLAYHQDRVWPYAPPLSTKDLAVNSVPYGAGHIQGVRSLLHSTFAEMNRTATHNHCALHGPS